MSFNEAGAINPGKPHLPRSCCGREYRFNEAGAINPGKRGAEIPIREDQCRFNEAGAINPGKRSIAKSTSFLKIPLQ